jgi:hypothetical protein
MKNSYLNDALNFGSKLKKKNKRKEKRLLINQKNI